MSSIETVTHKILEVPVLPEHGYVDQATAMAVFMLKKSQWHNRVKQGVLPRPIKVTGRALYDCVELHACLARARGEGYAPAAARNASTIHRL